MTANRLWSLVLLVSILGAAWAQPAFADEAAPMYDPSTVYAIDLTLPKVSEETLEEHPTDEYVEGALTLSETDGTPGTEKSPVIDEMTVGIRLKGNQGGSFRDLKDGKAAFKIKCNFISGKKCLGLKKMTLNNMVQDPSMIHETLAYAAFSAAGVPASRTGFAYVRVNGKDFGLYLNLETLDDVSLKRIFGSFDSKTQHLYEGELGDDVFPGGETRFEVDEGSEDDIGDLEALVAATNGAGDDPWSSRIAPHADLIEMTKLWAVEKYIGDWDGYSGHAEPGQERPNNYYLYSEPGGRFKMLPWGKDQTWQPTTEIPGREVTFDGPGGVLFNKCLEDRGCFRLYWEALGDATNAIGTLGPAALAVDTTNLLAPWQGKERADGRPEFDGGEVEDGVEETRGFIDSRSEEASQWLTENEPADEDGGDESAVPVKTAPLPESNRARSPDLVPGRFTVTGGVLVSRVWVSGAGSVGQHASISTRHGRIRVCATHEQALEAGPVVLRCVLSKGARRRLREKPLGLEVHTSFTPAGGSPTGDLRRLLVPRDPTL
jgi:hypothetical protein